MKHHSFYAAVLAAGIVTGSATFVMAQDTAVVPATAVQDADDDFDWGWLGLIGLIGLAGLAGRKRDRTYDTTRTVDRNVPPPRV